MSADRKQLVGLLTENSEEVLDEGAQVTEIEKSLPPVPMIGHVTSSYWSSNLGHSIAMALVMRGQERMGETLYVPRLDGTIAKARVTSPIFLDPEGSRLHG